MKLKISPFSAILIFVVLSFAGAASIPLLNLQYTPTTTGNTITLSFSYTGAPAEVVESTVTAKLEGIMSQLSGCTSTSSTSRAGMGVVSGTFSKHTDMAAARLEIISNIRNIYPRLPKGVSFPNISHNASGNRNTNSSISYYIMGDIPTQRLEEYTNKEIIPKISTIDGVNSININGGKEYKWVITFDYDIISNNGINPNEIASAIQNNISEKLIGLSRNDNNIAVRLSAGDNDSFEHIPIKKVGGKIIYLRDIADWRYQESEPTSYFRVNGLNTITLSIGMSADKNILRTSKEIRSSVLRLEEILPEEITMTLASDSSEEITNELNDILIKIAASILSILLFTLLVYRSWKYTLIILLATLGNTLICFAIYVVGNISIHIYTLVGVTIAMGITMGFYTIAINHYINRVDSKVLSWLIASAATIIGALIMILILPDEQKKNLNEFVLVISINLGVALVTSYIFIPAFLKYLPIKKREKVHSYRRKRRRVTYYNWYGRYINWGMRHKWVFILIGIMSFGIPTCMLPSYTDLREKSNKTKFERAIEKLVSWEPYRDNRSTIDKILSSSFGKFYNIFQKSDLQIGPLSKTISINARMPEGCTVSQLNEIMKSMEQFISGIEGVGSFTTKISSSVQGTIEVKFSPEYHNSELPSLVKANIISQAMQYGGVSWTITGINPNNYNNNITASDWQYRIELTGYNFEELDRYAKLLKDEISKNRRVQDVEIRSINIGKSALSELNMSYNFENIVLNGITPSEHYSALTSRLYDQHIANIYTEGNYSNVTLESSQKKEFDYWNMLNAPIHLSENSIVLKNIGNFEKLPSAIDIIKTNQSYVLNVCFKVLGSNNLANRIIEKNVTYFNEEILPLGFKASSPELKWLNINEENFVWIIFLIVVVIFVILSISLESLRNSLVTIFTILLSFIAPFLTFGMIESDFDQGGFAGFILLSGIIASACIYMIYGYEGSGFNYVKAIHRRFASLLIAIIAISVSALPFLLGGQNELFWFDFATVIIPGLILYLVIALLIFPVFLKKHTPDSLP